MEKAASQNRAMVQLPINKYSTIKHRMTPRRYECSTDLGAKRVGKATGGPRCDVDERRSRRGCGREGKGKVEWMEKGL